MDYLDDFVIEVTCAKSIQRKELVQTLWSDYGAIVRVHLSGSKLASVIVKHITFPEQTKHPRGWNTSASHQRKLASYRVEAEWYSHWSNKCGDEARVPGCYGITSVKKGEYIMVLEDLDKVGFFVRKSGLTLPETKLVLTWLANFHALFLNEHPQGLWEKGTYWHLATRKEEWNTMANGELKMAAKQLDDKLSGAHFQTIVHGDAKVANFCFTAEGEKVAGVDFQYVGGGCGMKDVAYLLGSCLTDRECFQWQDELLQHYFDGLKVGMELQYKTINFQALEEEWRMLFPVAWADFIRFLMGWYPTHQKINAYGMHMVKAALEVI